MHEVFTLYFTIYLTSHLSFFFFSFILYHSPDPSYMLINTKENEKFVFETLYQFNSKFQMHEKLCKNFRQKSEKIIFFFFFVKILISYVSFFKLT